MNAQSTPNVKIDLEEMPGHFIRRLQQIAVAIFLEETAEFGITPVQFAALSTVARQPDLDQGTLAASIGFDRATIGGVIDRLEKRGLVKRNASATDRRVKLLAITPEGATLLKAVVPQVRKAQKRIVQPLPPPERAVFFSMVRHIVQASNGVSRAPRKSD